MNIVVVLLIVYVFFVITGAARKMGRGTGLPPRRGPGPFPGPMPPGPRPGSGDRPGMPADRRPGSAAEMVPQDLWALLTGQVASGTASPSAPSNPDRPGATATSRSARSAAQSRPGAAAASPVDYDDIAIAAARAGAYDEETAPRRDLSTVPNASAEDIRREAEREHRSVQHPAAAVEAMQVLDATPGGVPARVGGARQGGAAGAAASPGQSNASTGTFRERRRAALRRAILAREILGPPKGLEGFPPRG